MNAAHRLPILGARQKHPCPDDIFKRGASLGKSLGRKCKDVPSLPCYVQIVGTRRSGSGKMNCIANTHRARESDNRLVWRTATDIFTHIFLR